MRHREVTDSRKGGKPEGGAVVTRWGGPRITLSRSEGSRTAGSRSFENWESLGSGRGFTPRRAFRNGFSPRKAAATDFPGLKAPASFGRRPATPWDNTGETRAQ